jgi:hypothetical protein
VPEGGDHWIVLRPVGSVRDVRIAPPIAELKRFDGASNGVSRIPPSPPALDLRRRDAGDAHGAER